MHSNDFYIRRAGVLLHPTSLPSGKLDGDVERWLEFMQQCGFQVWQVLPLGEPQQGLSPYQCVSAFALNPALLDDYPEVDSDTAAYLDFCEKSKAWLDDYALYKLLKRIFHQLPWYGWPDDYKYRDKLTLDKILSQHSAELDNLRWQQYILHTRWLQIKANARSKNIKLFGDIPIFVAHDSVDVWVCPERYLLDENGMMTVVTGVPPDYFSATGQRWGNPHYNWDFMQKTNFVWWIKRLSYHFELFDLVRIDHFRGLESAWTIAADSDTAIDGYYQKVPGDALLETVRRTIGYLPLVAEDLGVITDEVVALKEKFHLPGMSVLQFGFDAHEDNPHKVKNISIDCVVYTGTHDNDTTLGWYQKLDADIREKVLKNLTIGEKNEVLPELENKAATETMQDGSWTDDRVVDTMMLAALHSAAGLCIFPLQDCLHLGSDARMNTPGTENDNWTWRFQWAQINTTLASRLRSWIQDSQRIV